MTHRLRPVRADALALPARRQRRACAIVRVAGRWLAVLCGVTLATFVLINALPGNAAQVQLGTTGSSAEEAALTAKLGLNQPLLQRYVEWVGGLVRGNLGDSLASGQPVLTLLRERLPVSAELVGLAVIVALGAAVPAAVLSAMYPRGAVDRVITVLGVTAASVAPFVLGIGLVLVFALELGWFPAIGFVPARTSLVENLRSMVLPVCALALPLFGYVSRLLRADLVDVMLREDYILAARATGASPWRVATRHALRNGLFGVVGVLGVIVGNLLGATVVVEQVFALPGLGSELLHAVSDRDSYVVEAIVLLLATGVLLANSVAERTYRLLDRRVRVDH